MEKFDGTSLLCFLPGPSILWCHTSQPKCVECTFWWDVSGIDTIVDDGKLTCSRWYCYKNAGCRRGRPLGRKRLRWNRHLTGLIIKAIRASFLNELRVHRHHWWRPIRNHLRDKYKLHTRCGSGSKKESSGSDRDEETKKPVPWGFNFHTEFLHIHVHIFQRNNLLIYCGTTSEQRHDDGSSSLPW